jgi:DNA-binding NtrC family response regulator
MVEITLPRLVDRKEDLPLLHRYLLNKFATQYRKDIQGITRRAQVRLANHRWPGNVRELENVIGNACMMVEGPVIDIPDLPEPLRSQTDTLIADEETPPTLEHIQQRYILEMLERMGGNKVRTAEALGIGRATLYEILAKIRPTNTAQIENEHGSSEEPKLRIHRRAR